MHYQIQYTHNALRGISENQEDPYKTRAAAENRIQVLIASNKFPGVEYKIKAVPEQQAKNPINR